jgi:hypothetical protein
MQANHVFSWMWALSSKPPVLSAKYQQRLEAYLQLHRQQRQQQQAKLERALAEGGQPPDLGTHPLSLGSGSKARKRKSSRKTPTETELVQLPASDFDEAGRKISVNEV